MRCSASFVGTSAQAAAPPAGARKRKEGSPQQVKTRSKTRQRGQPPQQEKHETGGEDRPTPPAGKARSKRKGQNHPLSRNGHPI